MMWYPHSMTGLSVTGLLFVLLLIAAVVAVAVAARTRPAAGPESVLAERYARGEIDDKEYEHRLAVLRAEVTAPRSR
ncbi:SHOCT domain-containing protein [Dactylosporangium sp. AC04546]|uniref:SHOCT domain-containing protein n=1 Tax=Dactylosporangium sp. AC04546 TaxID=2862460 RepID=UPI001EDD7C2B|nr:SHOCT domain-containing protein [Dactylosporangium sp. AC04546]WVK78532.1 SHOCT domain-containing protein [Dactylosporangium sp. AC04546]